MTTIAADPRAIQRAYQPDRAGKTAASESEKKDKVSFSDMLKSSIETVNSQQISADSSIASFVSGKNEGLHETMMAIEKAEISMRLMVQVRNKAVEAYKEIMRMQV